ncbi:transposase [Streptomyces seoulensis]
MLIKPLLPPWPERAPGSRPMDDRLCLQGILYVLYSDIAWQLLPLELGFGGFGSEQTSGVARSGGSRPTSSTSSVASCSPN